MVRLNAVTPHFAGIEIQSKLPGDRQGVLIWEPGHYIHSDETHGVFYDGQGDQVQLNDGPKDSSYQLVARLDRTQLPEYDELMAALERRDPREQIGSRHRQLAIDVLERVRQALGGKTVPGVEMNPAFDKPKAAIFSARGIPGATAVLNMGVLHNSPNPRPSRRRTAWFMLHNAMLGPE